MITSTIASCFIGFLLVYFTSERAVISYPSTTVDWVRLHREESKILAIVFLVASALLAILQWGILGGAFSFIVILMTIGSLVLLLQPLRLFRPVSLVVLLIFIGLLELTV